MSIDARRSTFSTRTVSLTDLEDPYSVWTCSLTRGERELGVGVIVRVEDEPQSLLPCLRAKLSNQKMYWETDYALLTCHSNLDVVEGEPKFFNWKGLQASTRDTKIALEDCVSCAVSCCGPTSMLMLSATAPAMYTLLPHTNGHCPIGYDFVVLFLNKQFEPGETNLPPVVNVSHCLNLVSLRNLLEQQSGAVSQARNSATVHLYSHRDGVVPVKVQYSKEQSIVKRFCDEIDWYSQHQHLKYSPTSHSQSFDGAPIVCKHEGRRYLVGISSTGEQVITLYGICHLLAGGPVPLFAAMRDPSPRTLSPFRWSDHVLTHLASMAKKGYLLEMFLLLVDKEEGAALLNLVIADTMNVSVSAMTLLTEILNKFSGPEELGKVVRESHVFEPPNMSEDDFKGCILRVCRKLNRFMKHFSLVQRGKNPEKILESVFHCTEKMLLWSLQYPDVAECLLSNENVEVASKAAEKYHDSRSINDSFKNIRQSRDRMVERDLVRMRQQIARLQKELHEKEQELKNKQRTEDRKKVQSEEEKERQTRSSDENTRKRKAEILSARPTLKKLKMLRAPDVETVEIVSSVAPKWKDVGIFLDFDETGQCLDTIETGYEKDPAACCQAMFQHWLKGNGEEQTWEKLVEILKDSKLGALADKVVEGLVAQGPSK